MIPRRSSCTMSSALRSSASSLIAPASSSGFRGVVTCVEALLVYVAVDDVGNDVLDGLPPNDALTHIRRGQGDRGHVEVAGSLAPRERTQRSLYLSVAGTFALGDGHRSQREHALRLAPARQPRRHISAQDQKELGIGGLRGQLLKGIDREGRA